MPNLRRLRFILFILIEKQQLIYEEKVNVIFVAEVKIWHLQIFQIMRIIDWLNFRC